MSKEMNLYNGLADPISDFMIGSKDERRLPVLEIAPISGLKRTDKGDQIFGEGEEFLGIFENDFARSTLTLTPAPHTPEMVLCETVMESAIRNFGVTPSLEGLESIGAHLVVWWQQKNGGRCDMLSLAKLTNGERKAFIDAVDHQLEKGVRLMTDSLALSRDGHKDLRIYGLFGHATLEERKGSGLGRGAQSSPDGHLNIVFLPHDVNRETTLEEVSTKELVKQIGPWDTLVDSLFGSGIAQVIQDAAAKRIKNNLIKVRRVSDYTTSNDFSAVNFFEGFKLEFGKAIAFEQAFNVLADILKKSSDFYDLSQADYETYYKNYKNKAKMEKIKLGLSQRAQSFGFEKRMATRFADFVLSIRPTYGQLNKWIKDLEGNGSKKQDESLVYLKFLKRRYQNIFNKFHIPGNRSRAIKVLTAMDKLTENEADALLMLSEDKLKQIDDKTPNPSFIWAKHLSGSYLLDYKVDKSGQILVKGMSISTRLATDKGAVEDIGGFVIHRPQGS